jgi:hypothetical protein
MKVVKFLYHLQQKFNFLYIDFHAIEKNLISLSKVVDNVCFEFIIKMFLSIVINKYLFINFY